MIKSMTGFASLTRDDEAATISVTIKSVNHRFLDLQLRIPASLAPLETRLRALVQKRVARGRVEVVVGVQQRRAADPRRRAERGVPDGARRRDRARAGAGLRCGRDDARRSAAFPAGAGDSRAHHRSGRRPGAPHAAGREHCGRGARRARCHARHAKAAICGPTSMRGGRCSASCSSASRARPTRGWKALQARLARARAGAASRRAGRRGAHRAGDREVRRPVGHHRGGRAVPRASRALAGALRRARSRAAASSISCCRR